MRGRTNRRNFLRHAAAATAAVSCSPFAFADEKKILQQTHTYKRVGDLEIQADVLRPDDDMMRPVVFWIHGGALILGNRKSIDRRVKNAFLDAGYVIVSIDYRLAPETKLPQIVEDVEDAYRWVHDQGPRLFRADTKRIAVMGGSAGGYLTLTAGLRAKPRPAVLVSFWGYGDLVGDWYSKPSEFYRKQPLVTEADALNGFGDKPVADGSINGKQRGKFYLYCRQQGLWPKLVTGFDPHNEAENIAPYMPVRNVTADYPATMLIHGTLDTDVPYEQSALMEQEFKRHGVEHRFVTVPDANHGLAGGDETRIADAYAQVLPFVEKHVRG
ncbi:MAG: alpha/beta hydrolase [Planctomycetaceae bacterium]